MDRSIYAQLYCTDHGANVLQAEKEQLKVKTEMKMLHWIIGCLTVTQKAE